jgi:hypothetical protein
MRRLAGCALVLVCLCQSTGFCDEVQAVKQKDAEQKAAVQDAAAQKAPEKEEFRGEVVDGTSILMFAAPAAAPKEDAAPVQIEVNILDVFKAVVDEFVPAPAPALVPRGRDAQIEAQIKQILPHFLQQLRPVLTAELAFIRQFCDVPKELRPKIKAAGEASLQQAARELAGQQFPDNRGGLRRSNSPPDPRRTICEALARSLAENLKADQIARYTAESAKRTARRKEAAILCAVSQLDEALWLTEKQREQITVSISANWEGKWEQWLMLHRYGAMYYPTIPDGLVISHLNEEQRTVWNGLQKVDFGGWGGFDVQVQVDDDGWWGEPLARPGEAAGGVFGGPVMILNSP